MFDKVVQATARVSALQKKRSKSLSIFEKTKTKLVKINDEIDNEVSKTVSEIEKLKVMIKDYDALVTDCNSQKESNLSTIEKIDKIIS